MEPFHLLAVAPRGREARRGIPVRLQSNSPDGPLEGRFMNSIIYLVGLVVIVLAILSFLGIR